jgi:hypothetical protein
MTDVRSNWLRMKILILGGAIVGLVIPLVILFIGHIDPLWWPTWILYVWPTVPLLMATDGAKGFDLAFGYFFVIGTNMLLNSIAGLILFGILKLVLPRSRKSTRIEP